MKVSRLGHRRVPSQGRAAETEFLFEGPFLARGVQPLRAVSGEAGGDGDERLGPAQFEVGFAENPRFGERLVELGLDLVDDCAEPQRKTPLLLVRLLAEGLFDAFCGIRVGRGYHAFLDAALRSRVEEVPVAD